MKYKEKPYFIDEETQHIVTYNICSKEELSRKVALLEREVKELSEDVNYFINLVKVLVEEIPMHTFEFDVFPGRGVRFITELDEPVSKFPKLTYGKNKIFITARNLEEANDLMHEHGYSYF